MSSNWKTKPLGKLANNVSRRFDFTGKDQVVFINTGDVLEGKFLHKDYVGSKGLPGQAKKAIERGDILYSEIRPGNKRYVLVDFDPKDFVISTKFMVIKPTDEVLPEFLYLILTSKDCEQEFKLIADSRSGTFPQITFDSVSYYPIKYPDKTEQKRLLKITDCLSGKIDINTQTNQTLEHIAQALFKSWFVDFDPVKAKIAALEAGGTAIDAKLAAMSIIAAKSPEQLAELKQSKPDAYEQLAQTAALFPSAMQESELGDIPEGWSKGTIEDIVKFSSERIDVTELSLNNYISTENMLENKKGITIASSLPSGKSVPAFDENEILISNIRPYFKKIWLTEFKGGRSPDVLGFTPVEKNETEFAYNLLYQNLFFEYMMTTSKGAKMPRGDKSALKQFDFPLPPENLRLMYSKQVDAIYPTIRKANQETELLHALRDALLPELLTGKLGVA